MQSSPTLKPGRISSAERTAAPDTHDDWKFSDFSDWFEDPTVSEDSEGFQRLISCEQDDVHAASDKSKIWASKFPGKPPFESPTVSSHASFGEGGVTASVNAYGNLIQITRYLAAGRSGFFSIDQREIWEPYFTVQRPHDLLHYMRGPNEGIGLLSDISPKQLPTLEFVYDRWPRFTHETDGLRVSIQHMIRDNTVIQQYSLQRIPDEKTFRCPKFSCASQDLLIRDLEWLDAGYEFNEDRPPVPSYQTVLGLHQRSLIITHSFQSNNHLGSTSGQSQATMKSDDLSVKDHQSAESPVHSSEEQGTLRDTGKPAAVGLVMALFINGVATKIEEDARDLIDNSQDLSPNSRISAAQALIEASLRDSGKVEITAAYRPQLMRESCNHWMSSVIPASVTNVEHTLAERPPQKVQFSSSPKLDFILRRNLEHILSVCAITTSDVPIWDYQEGSENLRDEHSGEQRRNDTGEVQQRQGDEVSNTVNENFSDAGKQHMGGEESSKQDRAIAITCGDLSGHHIVTSASFFAFKFLLAMFDHLQQNENTDATRSLLQRIYKTCNGHVDWILEKAAPGLERDGNVEDEDTFSVNTVGDSKQGIGGFGSNHWANGTPIDLSQDWRYSPSRSLMDTPFQIIKVSGFDKTFKTFQGGLNGHKRKLLCDQVRLWVKDLAEDDRQGHFAFKRVVADGVGQYRLEDHVWIWLALKSLEELELSAELQHCTTGKVNEEENTRKFSSSEAQINILRRFTTDNVVSRKRMIATTRSARETRFLLHARDTSLFYTMAHDFFNADSRGPLWENTIDSQIYHDYNNEEQWENPLRYGLAMVMGSKRRRLNNLRTAKDSFSTAANLLFQSSYPTGLFAGELDETTKQPALFSDRRYRDYYWHVGFEIPFIFWQYGRQILENPKGAQQKNEPDNVNITTPPTKPAPTQPIIEIFQSGTGLEIRQNSSLTEKVRLKGLPGARDIAVSADASRMKKTIPFNDIIDQKSIIELSDEWLYSYPDFLEYHPNIRLVESTYESRVRDFAQQGADTVITKYIMDGGLRDLAHSMTETGGYYGSALVLDVPRAGHSRRGKFGKANVNEDALTKYELWDKLNRRRTAQSAKKQLIWLPSQDKGTAVLCYLASPPTQREAVSDFFDRHATFEKYLFDDIVAFQNTWETEFHLSFYQLFHDSVTTREVLPDISSTDFPEIGGKKLGRAAIGFRFIGDFFDRYWTCHVVEYHPAKSPEDHTSPRTSKSLQGLASNSWTQRKVLELVLFDRMLEEITKSTKEILEEIRQELGVRKDTLTFAVSNTNDYFSSSRAWQKFHQILQAIEEDLSAIMEEVQNWNNRELDRGQERPRWTKNDERKYRRAINKVLGHNQRNSRKLQSYLSNIQSWKASLQSTQESLREDLNLRGAEDIRFFTYVTVVFLPLGFAASIFSMSEAPPRTVLASMVVTAAVALLLTMFALINAKTMAAMTRDVNRDLKNSSERILRESVLARSFSPWKVVPKAPLPEETGHFRRRLRLLGRRLRRAWFWVVYFAHEYPGRRVGGAYDSVRRAFRKGSSPQSDERETAARGEGLERQTTIGTQETSPLGDVTDLGDDQPDSDSDQQPSTYAVAVERVLTACDFVFHGFLAVLFLPVFLLSLAARVIVTNVSDLTYLLSRGERRDLASEAARSSGDLNVVAAEDVPTYEKLLETPHKVRPFARRTKGENEKGKSEGDLDADAAESEAERSSLRKVLFPFARRSQRYPEV